MASNLIPRDVGAQMRAMMGSLVGNEPRHYMTVEAARKHARTTGDVLRSGGESAVVGAVLGIVNASRQDGLDVRIPGVTKVGAPIDGMAALGFGIAAIASAQEDFAKDFVNASAAASAIFAFRKMSDWVTEMRIKQSGVTPGGGAQLPGRISKATFGAESVGWAAGSTGADIGEDPIVVAGKRL